MTNMNKAIDVILDLQISDELSALFSKQCDENIKYPKIEEMTDWVNLTLLKDAQYQNKKPAASVELTIRLVETAEIQELNKTYRHIDKATNILSFPFEAPEFIAINLLGDLVICHSVIEKEAVAQKKLLSAHWAHIIIHGVLHLLGYDHIEDNQAQQMEALETEIMQDLGFKNPYL